MNFLVNWDKLYENEKNISITSLLERYLKRKVENIEVSIINPKVRLYEWLFMSDPDFKFSLRVNAR